MLRTIWGDDARYVQTYFSQWPGRPDLYFPGDGAKRDADGDFWILGRVDDVLNVAGHRIGTMEVESALVEHPAVAEAAVVGKAHEIKGQAICAFVTLRDGHAESLALRDDLRAFVAQKIGALARPDELHFTATSRRPARGRSCGASSAIRRRAPLRRRDDARRPDGDGDPQGPLRGPGGVRIRDQGVAAFVAVESSRAVSIST